MFVSDYTVSFTTDVEIPAGSLIKVWFTKDYNPTLGVYNMPPYIESDYERLRCEGDNVDWECVGKN